jgi:hypothetical protein
VCQFVPLSLVGGLAERLLADGLRLQMARAVRVDPELRNDQGWPELIVAARIVGEDIAPGGVTAAWAVGSAWVPVHALNAAAREFTSWGARAGGKGSQAEFLDRLAASQAVRQVVRCVEAGWGIA